MAVNYSTYDFHGQTIVTVNYDRRTSIEHNGAFLHLEYCGRNTGDYGSRYIFSDRGDRSRFDAFEQAVVDARMDTA